MLHVRFLPERSVNQVPQPAPNSKPTDNPKTYSAPGALNSTACRRDTCCVWDSIQNDLTDIFLEDDSTCNRLARQAVRLGFHDAGTWSRTSRTGGADGSLLLSPNEMTRSANNGMQDIREVGLEILDRYQDFNISAGDLVQFMHNVAVVVCPLGPRMLTFVGRTDSDEASAGLIPTADLSADEIVETFANKTFGTRDIVALVGAHTTAEQFFVNTDRAGAPLDTTPGIWDVNYYQEVLTDSPPRLEAFSPVNKIDPLTYF